MGLAVEQEMGLLLDSMWASVLGSVLVKSMALLLGLQWGLQWETWWEQQSVLHWEMASAPELELDLEMG